MNKLKLTIKIFFKGIFMGLSDIIPGISGGTIALITGIYERLIYAINSIDLKIPLYLIEGNFDKAKLKFKEIDLELLVPLGIGIITAFFTASKFILTALERFPAFTYSFFLGLILASAIKIYRETREDQKFGNVFIVLLGTILAFYIIGLSSLRLTHSPVMIFVSGSIAICAMILPGISGSFILLTLGQYQYMLKSLHNISVRYLDIIIFMLGALISLFTFSKFLSELFKDHETLTFSFLIGIMLGALRVPLTKILFVNDIYPLLDFVWSLSNILITLLLGFLGFIVVFILEMIE